MTGQIYLRKGGERINNMKSRMLAGRMLFAMLVPAVGYCAYPTIEEAQALFSSAQMNATNVWLTSQSYSDFRNRLCEPASYEDICAVENFVVCAMTSIVMRVSTNEIDESVGVSIAHDRGWYFRTVSDSFPGLATNSIVCLILADYLGRVAQTDFPTTLAKMRGPLIGRKMFISTNSAEMAQWQEQEGAARTERETRLHEILTLRNLQLRVAEANRSVGDYRREVFAICARSVAGCRGMMNEEEFSVFTNQVVTVSRANADEQRILFQYIDSVAQ